MENFKVTAMKREPVVVDADDVTFESEPSTILKDAVDEFEKSRQEAGEDEWGHSEEAWSILANQVVGHENL